MAADIPRTARDDARDALAALDDAEREIVHLRAHLRRLEGGGELPVAMAARHCAAIVAALTSEADAHTRAAVRHAEDLWVDALPIG